MLSDVGSAVADSYGLVFRLPDYLQDAYDQLGHPLPLFNGAGRQSLPIPATFVVASDGVVRFAYANPDYTYRADPEDILATLKSLPWAGSNRCTAPRYRNRDGLRWRACPQKRSASCWRTSRMLKRRARPWLKAVSLCHGSRLRLRRKHRL